jgi:hypothetical protein
VNERVESTYLFTYINFAFNFTKSNVVKQFLNIVHSEIIFNLNM